MNGFKKLLGTALAALMVAGSGSAVLAKTYDDVKDAAQTEISILSDLGVIRGTSDNEFSPDDPVTREQMAALLFRLMLGRDDAGRVNTTGFEDLYEPYYNGAISWANAAGYILGTSEKRFNPTGGITKQDAMTMLVRALGQDNAKMNDGYPWSYINAAVKLGLDRGLEKRTYTDTLTRAETAVILYNALTAEYLVGRNTSGGSVAYESTSVIEEVFGYRMTEAALIATNDYALDDSAVVKNGYVTLLGQQKQDGRTLRMTVPASALNLNGSVNEHLGLTFRVIYSEADGRYTVLSAVPTSRTEVYTDVSIADNGRTVKIGDSRYTLVSEYSDELATNNNELKLYAFDRDGNLSLVKDTDELKELLGFYRLTLVTENGAAKLGVLRTYRLGVLNVDEEGRVNLADSKKKDDLRISNPNGAENSDYVLYSYRAKTAELEIAEVLEAVSGTVKRITDTSAKIGDGLYRLGNETAGISVESIRNKLTLGENVTVIVYGDTVAAVPEGKTVSDASRYLVALTDSVRVYENGSFRYVMTAFLDGEEKNLYVNDSSAEKGGVYRYTETAGVYTLTAPKTDENGLILSGRKEFIQKSDGLDEIAVLIDRADGTEIRLDGRNTFTLTPGNAEMQTSGKGMNSVRFLCDKDTVIVVNRGGRLYQRTGEYASTIRVEDGSKVAAILDNEVGSVETLKYLYLSDGSLGNYDLDAAFVRVLAKNGMVYENGEAYAEYTVYNFGTGEIETRLSKNGDLTVGGDYRCGQDETVTADKADAVMSGFLTGYTSGTVSVDGETFSLGKDTKIVRITKDHRLESVKLMDLYMRHVEFIAERGTVTLILEAGEAQFDAEADETGAILRPDFDLNDFSDSRVTLVSLKRGEENVEGAELTVGEDNTLVLRRELEEGRYVLTFTIGSKTFTASFDAEKPETPEQPVEPVEPEQPEQPADPEQPVEPADPEQPETPEATEGSGEAE